PAAVAALLENECAGDAELRREVERLLALDAEAESLMDRPLLEKSGFHLLGALTDEFDPLIGRRIGSYEIRRELG
ncbi:MAG: hypothetical protein JSS81_26390, partial [Acidobacteria bacterium]|nr:hypothetical protein [Acidobacteriota bacterium]